MKRSQDMDRTRRPLPPRHCGAVRQQNYSTIVLLFWCTVGSVAWWLCNGCGVSGSRSRLSCGRGGRPEICIQHRGGQSVGRRLLFSKLVSLEALFSTVLDGDPQSLPYLISKSKKWKRRHRKKSYGAIYCRPFKFSIDGNGLKSKRPEDGYSYDTATMHAFVVLLYLY